MSTLLIHTASRGAYLRAAQVGIGLSRFKLVYRFPEFAVRDTRQLLARRLAV
jgi:hypothetical protein